MSQAGETFFTTIGCMDGRCQESVAIFGKNKFSVQYPDTITEAGLVGLLAQENVDENLLNSLKKKVLISTKKHHSKGIVVYGHEDCAGNPVGDEAHKNDVRASVKLVQSLVSSSIPIVGVFVKRDSTGKWTVEEL